MKNIQDTLSCRHTDDGTSLFLVWTGKTTFHVIHMVRGCIFQRGRRRNVQAGYRLLEARVKEYNECCRQAEENARKELSNPV